MEDRLIGVDKRRGVGFIEGRFEERTYGVGDDHRIEDIIMQLAAATITAAIRALFILRKRDMEEPAASLICRGDR